MKPGRYLILIWALFAISAQASPVLADDARPPPEADPHTAQSPPATRIEADDQAGVIRFFVKGQLAATLDETGLHVRDSIDYGGTITDANGQGFARSASPKGQADEK